MKCRAMIHLNAEVIPPHGVDVFHPNAIGVAKHQHHCMKVLGRREFFGLMTYESVLNINGKHFSLVAVEESTQHASL